MQTKLETEAIRFFQACVTVKKKALKEIRKSIGSDSWIHFHVVAQISLPGRCTSPGYTCPSPEGQSGHSMQYFTYVTDKYKEACHTNSLECLSLSS